MSSKNDTMTVLRAKMCYFGFGGLGRVSPRHWYKLPVSVQDDKTWLDIIYSAISDTLTNTADGTARDEVGSIAIRELCKELQLDLVLGDESLAYEYEYEKGGLLMIIL